MGHSVSKKAEGGRVPLLRVWWEESRLSHRCVAAPLATVRRDGCWLPGMGLLCGGSTLPPAQLLPLLLPGPGWVSCRVSHLPQGDWDAPSPGCLECMGTAGCNTLISQGRGAGDEVLEGPESLGEHPPIHAPGQAVWNSQVWPWVSCLHLWGWVKRRGDAFFGPACGRGGPLATCSQG